MNSLFTIKFVTSCVRRCIRAQNSSFKGAHKSGTLMWCVLHAEPCLFCSRLSSRPKQSPLVTGRKITLSTNIPNHPMAVTACSCCHSKLRSTGIKQTGTPRIWQICRCGRHSVKSAERIRGTKPSGFSRRVVTGLETVRCNGLGTVRFRLEFRRGTERFHFYPNRFW